MNMQITDSSGVTYDFTPVTQYDVSSQENDSLRWTEIALYRTTTGKWVIHTIGASDVVHKRNTRCRTDGDLTAVSTIINDEPAPCPVCEPDLSGAIHDTFVIKEKDRHTVVVCETDDDVIKALTAHRHGQVYISRLSQLVMAKAGIGSQVIEV